jgi:hypothetical protein
VLLSLVDHSEVRQIAAVPKELAWALDHPLLCLPMALSLFVMAARWSSKMGDLLVGLRYAQWQRQEGHLGLDPSRIKTRKENVERPGISKVLQHCTF